MDFDARGKAAGATSIKGTAAAHLAAGAWLIPATGTWREALGLDYRSLALYRLLIGIVIVYDMLDRWDDTYAWYSDQGTPCAQSMIPSTPLTPAVQAFCHARTYSVTSGIRYDERAPSDAPPALIASYRATCQCTWSTARRSFRSSSSSSRWRAPSAWP